VPRPQPFRLQPIAPQTIEAGKTLNVTATVENAEAWKGKLRYSLGPNAPVGLTIGSETGVLAWTPAEAQKPGKYDVTVSVEAPDGQRDKTVFAVTVSPRTAPTVAEDKEIFVDLDNGVKLEMVLIPAGEFMMGSPDSDKTAGNDEKPQHRVRITRPFYLGKYLVTQEQWEAVMGNNPSNFEGRKNPVEQVSWDDCQQFLGKLNERFHRPHPSPLPEGEGEFRLPTEAQWEYACRAGSTAKFCYGDSEAGLSEYAWYGANSGGKTHPVGGKKPNAWGLYDMHGNVWESCQDWYDDGYDGKSATDDPVGPATGSSRVDRGGGWDYVARYCRSARRYSYWPGLRSDHLGLRVSRVLADK
jgi:formylglycine-generating enzyme required for sulfatase activity